MARQVTYKCDRCGGDITGLVPRIGVSSMAAGLHIEQNFDICPDCVRSFMTEFLGKPLAPPCPVIVQDGPANARYA